MSVRIGFVAPQSIICGTAVKPPGMAADQAAQSAFSIAHVTRVKLPLCTRSMRPRVSHRRDAGRRC